MNEHLIQEIYFHLKTYVTQDEKLLENYTNAIKEDHQKIISSKEEKNNFHLERYEKISLTLYKLFDLFARNCYEKTKNIDLGKSYIEKIEYIFLILNYHFEEEKEFLNFIKEKHKYIFDYYDNDN